MNTADAYERSLGPVICDCGEDGCPNCDPKPVRKSAAHGRRPSAPFADERCANCRACTDGDRIAFGVHVCSPGCEATILREIAAEEAMTRELADGFGRGMEEFEPSGVWLEEVLS